MKRFVKYVCLVLIFSLCFTTTVFAAEDTAPRASNYFYRYGGYLSLISGSTFGACFDVTATGVMSELGVSTIEIQRSYDGSSGWLTMKTFNKGSYLQMIGENASRHNGYVTYAGTPGYYYRAYITFYAKNNSGVGMATYHTSPIRIPNS